MVKTALAAGVALVASLAALQPAGATSVLFASITDEAFLLDGADKQDLIRPSDGVGKTQFLGTTGNPDPGDYTGAYVFYNEDGAVEKFAAAALNSRTADFATGLGAGQFAGGVAFQVFERRADKFLFSIDSFELGIDLPLEGSFASVDYSIMLIEGRVLDEQDPGNRTVFQESISMETKVVGTRVFSTGTEDQYGVVLSDGPDNLTGTTTSRPIGDIPGNAALKFVADPFEGVIDLSSIDEGEIFTLTLQWQVASAFNRIGSFEGFANASFIDPLNIADPTIDTPGISFDYNGSIPLPIDLDDPVVPTPVPAPPAIALLLGALGLLGVVRRRRPGR